MATIKANRCKMPIAEVKIKYQRYEELKKVLPVPKVEYIAQRMGMGTAKLRYILARYRKEVLNGSGSRVDRHIHGVLPEG